MGLKDFPFDELNSEQLEGIVSTDGPVLVLAGAGSGKTRMLTYKIAYLIKVLGVKPHNIFATTFTNKAADEMKHRVEMLVGGDVNELWIGTFHSLCGRILRVEASQIGLTPGFTIYDEDDSTKVVRNVLDELKLDSFKQRAKTLLSKISSLKERLITPDEFKRIAKTQFETKVLLPVYEQYQQALKWANAVDFDDMIMYVVLLFKEKSDIEEKWSTRFRYILVDEFQDTNLAQYELIKHLSKINRNITVVGDDDQSIYSWRGAEVKNILNFPIDFENTKIIKLERNYRSTKSILDLANAVIRNNRIRYEKVLWCENEIGEKPLLRACSSELDEAKRVVDEIERLLEAGVESNKIAVLYRINAQSRTFEEELSRRGILYQIVGGISFYERAEIKDMLAYLRLIVNPKDNVAFMRAVNTPPRGVGRSSLNALAEISTKEGLSLYEASKNASGLRISSRAKAGLKEFVDLVEQAKEKSNNVYAALKEIVEKSGYIKMLEEEASLESEDRIENIYELLSSAYSFVDAHTERGSVADYLADVSLLTSVDLWDDSLNRVNLMTIHSAKGLEFDYVFLVGLEDGLFPLFSAYEQEHDLEEERRLFYVAITRAKKRLYLSFARSRLLRGQQNYSTPSIFLTEIPKEFVNEEKPSIDSVCDDDFQITINSIVLHPYFGQGRVVEIRGYGKNAIVTVYFKSHGLVKLSLAHTELELL